MTDSDTGSTRLEIKNLQHPSLQIDSFYIKKGESWCIHGGRNSGIDQFLDLISGKIVPDKVDTALYPCNPSILSFDEQQQIYEDEIRKDDTDFMDRLDPGTPARDFLPPDRLSDPLIDRFGMRNLLDSGYRQLSSGQARKLLLLRALFSDSEFILLDCPYDGLDTKSCRELNEVLSAIPAAKYCLVIIVRNISDIPRWCSHLACFQNHSLRLQGKREIVIGDLSIISDTLLLTPGAEAEDKEEAVPAELIRLRNGSISYDGNTIFKGLDLTIRPGDHTLVTGPNGCGKSSLLQMITGDNPKCYMNDLQIYGKQRGSGESVWDIKRHMGIVSADLHRNYRVACTCLQVVLSGYFDSIGLYDKVSTLQKNSGMKWLQSVKLERFRDKSFRQLPYGDQRLLLIARAFIKNPRLLILDEPTQGLDDGSRNSLLTYLEETSKKSTTTILFVSHREDEYRPFFRQHIELERFAPAQPS